MALQAATITQPTMPKKELADLPDEVICNMVRHMDNLSCVCFALTSHKNRNIVSDVEQHSLKSLCPSFDGQPWVQVGGTTQHECLIRQLWQWLGKRCVFCGIPEAHVTLYTQEGWIYSGHVCSGWLSQPNSTRSDVERIMYTVHHLDFQMKFDRGMIEQYYHSGKISEAAMSAWLEKKPKAFWARVWQANTSPKTTLSPKTSTQAGASYIDYYYSCPRF